MKEFIINKSINTICKQDPYISKEKKEILIYGLEALYITISKFIIISIIAASLGIFKEHLIFLLIYNVLRTFAGGVHAKDGKVCLVVSTITFLVIPLCSVNFEISLSIKILLFVFSVVLMSIYAPADTVKKPMIKKSKRIRYKIISLIVVICYFSLSLVIKDLYISNAFSYAIVLSTIMILPITYKLFGVPYRNYMSYKH